MKKIGIILLVALVIGVGFFYSVSTRNNRARVSSPKTEAKKVMKHLVLKSPAFSEKGNIPAKYTCDGEDINPAFEIENVPDDATSLVFVVEDPDAPGKTWIHWVVFNISPHINSIQEDSIPGNGVEGMTDFGKAGYGGPCPPSGTHRYYFKLYALDSSLRLTEDVTLDELTSAMDGHVLDSAELVGLYSRE